jgi:hypothetical protein
MLNVQALSHGPQRGAGMAAVEKRCHGRHGAGGEAKAVSGKLAVQSDWRPFANSGVTDVAPHRWVAGCSRVVRRPATAYMDTNKVTNDVNIIA